MMGMVERTMVEKNGTKTVRSAQDMGKRDRISARYGFRNRKNAPDFLEGQKKCSKILPPKDDTANQKPHVRKI